MKPARRMLCPMILTVSALVLPEVGRADEFSSTDAQMLYGAEFHDRYIDADTVSGQMATFKLEHSDRWSYGDNYFLIDFYQGDFTESTQNPSGQHVKAFGKYTPRLSIGKLAANKQGSVLGPFWDVLVAGQFYRNGNGFWANFVGIGLDLIKPSQNVLSINLFFRKDRFNSATFQISPTWTFPFEWAGIGLELTGYLDISGTDSFGVDIFAQPQLLVDVGKALRHRANVIQTGLEWTLHHNDAANTSAPEGLLKWTL